MLNMQWAKADMEQWKRLKANNKPASVTDIWLYLLANCYTNTGQLHPDVTRADITCETGHHIRTVRRGLKILVSFNMFRDTSKPGESRLRGVVTYFEKPKPQSKPAEASREKPAAAEQPAEKPKTTQKPRPKTTNKPSYVQEVLGWEKAECIPDSAQSEINRIVNGDNSSPPQTQSDVVIAQEQHSKPGGNEQAPAFETEKPQPAPQPDVPTPKPYIEQRAAGTSRIGALALDILDRNPDEQSPIPKRDIIADDRLEQLNRTIEEEEVEAANNRNGPATKTTTPFAIAPNAPS